MTSDARARLRHDLRTPLNHILGYSEMLLEDAGDGPLAVLAPGLQALHGQARQVLALIDACLDPGAAGAVPAAWAVELAPPLETMRQAVDALRRLAPAAEAAAGADLHRIAHAVEALQALAAGAAAPAPPTVPARTSIAGAVLVVDDDADNRDLLARRLAREGHTVRTAAGGAEALAMLEAGGVDLLLLDVMMPGLDGHEVLRQVKADPRWQALPVLMISALDESGSIARCIEAGAEDYLPKPFDPVILSARVGACLEKKRLRDLETRHAQTLAELNRTLEARVAEQVAQLERLTRLRRFFSPALAQALVDGAEDDPMLPHRRDITVCFIDLRGFTAFADSAESEDVMALLAQFHATVGPLIMAHEGTLERFTGDGMMVFFNDPLPQDRPAERAAAMALAVRDAVAQLAVQWRSLGHALDVGIGIAQGYATIGAIGFEGRRDYAAIGSVTNLAARLCAEAGPGQILVSQRVLAAAGGSLQAEPVGELQLKGFARPVRVHRLVGLEPGATAAG